MDLKQKRLEYGLTQFDMAKKLGVSINTYRLWEYRVSTPKEQNEENIRAFFEQIKKETNKNDAN